MSGTIDTESARPPSSLSQAIVSLERHQRRREQGVPTVSALCGPVGLGARQWVTWSTRHGLEVVRTSATAGAEIVCAWVRALGERRDLVADALAWLARTTGHDIGEMQRHTQSITRTDFEWFWHGLELPATKTGPAALCRLILLQHGSGLSSPAKDGPVHAITSDGGRSFDPQLVADFAEIVPESSLPALMITPPPGVGASLAGVASCLVSLAAAAPALPVALAAEVSEFEALTPANMEAHALAVLREGVIPVESLSQAVVLDRLKQAGVNTDPASVARLAGDGVSDDLVAAFAEAASQTKKKGSPQEEDAARSAAERFLFERLETLAATSGLFELNQRLDFHHGSALAEADLFAASLRLVIELDGSYFHLQDPDAYRRDRKKDWEFQRRGYLVLRFLSEDVVERLEVILDTILAAVEYCRVPHPEQGKST